MASIRKAEPRDIEAIRSFYESVGYSSGASEEDLIFLAESGNQLLGVVRLCQEHQFQVLRGMQVHPDHQKKGIGTQLLDAIQPAVARQSCWCIPYAHVEEFYGTIGFERADPETAPFFLQERIREYTRRGFNVICMLSE